MMKLIAAFLQIFLLGMSLTCYAQDPSIQEESPASSIQMAMDVHVVQMVLNDEHRDGVDWEAIVSDFHTLQLKKEANPVWADKRYKISVGTVSNEDYAVLLDALDTVGQLNQLPQPPVTLTRGEQDSINVALGETSTGNMRINALWSQTGGKPKLRVEPWVSVLLKDSNTSVATTLRAKTSIALRENMTIIIGGITSEEEIAKVHKIPVLGDLPILGLVFRKQGRLMQKIETVVFLTPHFKAEPVEDEKIDE